MNEIPSDESDEMRHSHINLPLVTYPVIAELLEKFRNNLSNEVQLNLASGVTDKHVVNLLSRICYRLVYDITVFLLKSLERHVLKYAHMHLPRDENNYIIYGNAVLMNRRPLFDGCSYCRVTESDVYSSLGDILDTCFGQFLGTVQRWSSDSVRLRTLLSVEIAKLMNSNLCRINGSTSVESDKPRPPPRTKAMVYHLMNILGDCFNAKDAPLWAQSSQDNDAEIPGSRETACPLPQHPKCSIDETFLTLCLAKLIDHIAVKTHTSVANLDFHHILTRVKERIVEDQSYTVPQSVKNLHVTIYNKLCRKFGSKYVLQSVMEQGDEAFVEAFVEMLKAQLKKSTEKTSKSKKMWRIFRRNNKVDPVCNNKATESHIEENEKENVRQQNRQCSGIKRACSSIFIALRKAFICCLTKQSETEESLKNDHKFILQVNI
ncbi:uncharacterized protein LOC115798773 isoform X1 [Archocentrus centrarchus]|uniref:uncharacterized protein LOC115798773 isoform X1 n=1 Tax=Archocentrus centrarchus TaxID=63155 RepID=UPI0011E9DA45|nr:uncharacterized protein LOC115798773 isoform X1 [Archocentrus centrarchus]